MQKAAFIIEDNTTSLEQINLLLRTAGIEAHFVPCGLEYARTQFSEPVDCVKLSRKARDLEHAQARLKWSEARMHHFARIAADWFWETDEEHRVIWSSDGPVREGDYMTDVFAGLVPGLLPGEQGAEVVAALRERRAFQNTVLEIELASGERCAVRIAGEPVLDPNGDFSGFRGVGHDYTEALHQSRQVIHEANHDALTGLYNRREFLRRVQRAWLRSRQDGVVHALCFIDLDHFKQINDQAGHAAGDALLAQLAGVMREQVRGGDTVARLGGDEFCVLLENCALEYALRVSNELIGNLRGLEFEWQGEFHPIAGSIGITLITRDTEDVNQAMVEADLACYTAKNLGRDRVHVYHQTDSRHVAGG